MTFEEVVDQAIDMIRRRGQVTYRMLKRQFDLDESSFEDLRDEILYSQSKIVDDEGRGFAWTDSPGLESSSPSTSTPTQVPDQPSSPISYTPQYLTEKILISRTAMEGERKQVTVLFADIKDSTELIQDLDPEEAQKLLDPSIHIMMETVHQFEGTVNQVLGDGIMALFGAPLAHEDHAARACYAALAMQAAMHAHTEEVLRAHGIPLQVRVGLNSGEVVVRAIGNDLHMDYSAVGQTTNLAARMEQLATPGRIMLTGGTLRLVEGLVRVDARGPIPVKGMNEPVDVYELTGASSIRRRLQASVARGLTKFVGRDTEIDVLNQTLYRAGQGQGQVVAVVGEAGVGKSRLVYEFVHSHRTQGWLVLESASVSYGKATPYFPMIDLLKRYVHVKDGDEPRAIRAKVTGHILTLEESLQETIPALLSLLDALPENSPFRQLDPPQRRQRTLDAFKQMLLRESQVQPLVLVFEDLHWIDSETQALLDHLIESLPTAQLLLLVNYRPEYQDDWRHQPFYTQLPLDPLPPERADELLHALLGHDSTLDPLKPLLIERTEGNPFFLEESVRTLAETQVLVGESGAYRLAQALPTIQVPATVQAILATRIDRLPQDEKLLLQTAAVIGNEVPFSLLQAIAELSEEALHRGLTHLQGADFLYETSLFPERVYTFKHALTHEVAYGSLLQERRRGLHARIVDALEALAGDRWAEQVERLAHHAWRGERWDKTVTYCQQAGMRVYDRAAFREAVAYFDQALEALTHLPEHRQTQEQSVELRLALDRPLTALGEYRRRLALLGEAETLVRTLGDQPRLGRVLAMMVHARRQTGDPEGAIGVGQQALELAAELGHSALQVHASHTLGQACHAVGDFRRASELLRWSAEAADRESVASTTHFCMQSRAWLAWALGMLGDFVEGQRYGEEALRLAAMEGRGASPMVAHGCLGYMYLAQGNLTHAIRVFDQGQTLCRASGNWDWLRSIVAGLGYVYVLQGSLTEGRALLEEAIREHIRTGAQQNLSLRLAWLSEVCRLEGSYEEAWQHACQALDLARQHKERANEALALHQLGAAQADAVSFTDEPAETYFQQALTLTTELGMRPLQAHCHRGLGTLYHQAGHSEKARAELSTAIEMYREMEMTFWLPETEVALEDVEG